MISEPGSTTAGREDNPLTDFSNCHIGIVKNFERLRTLANTTIESPVPKDVQQAARKIYDFFGEVVQKHHDEEEQELFAEVKDSARGGSEDAQKALQMIDQLVAEHRSLEAQWANIADTMRRLAKGQPIQLDQEKAVKLAEEYLAHAHFEEQEFLPLSEKLLGERGLSSLGLSLHMRHQDAKLPSYI